MKSWIALLLVCCAVHVAPAAAEDEPGLPTRVLLFERDVYKLTAEQRRLLARHADVLRGDRRLRLMVQAFGDARGEPEYGRALADKRAEMVIRVLVSMGVEPYQVEARAFDGTRTNSQRVDLVYFGL
jgi:outer membrane protein OmpA-like peptidoglycan-associated protein